MALSGIVALSFNTHNVVAVSEREPRCLRLPSARPPGLAALPHTLRYLYAVSSLRRLLPFGGEPSSH